MRRVWIVIASWIGIALGAPATSAADAVNIAPGVDLIPGTFVAGRQPDGNSVIFTGPDGLVVFDTGRHPEHAQAIIDFATRKHAAVRAIVNSHWHLDHVGGNIRLRAAYPRVEVYASTAIEDAMRGFLANYHRQLEQMIRDAGDDESKQAPWRAELALIDAGPALYPDHPVTATAMRTLAGRRLHLGLESRAVTAGDVWAFDPATRVLASGDLVTLPAPLFDTACPVRWRTALDRLAAIDFAWLVPGHGAPMRREGFATYRRAFNRLLACAAGNDAKQVCVDGWMRDAAPLIPEADRDLAKGLLGYYVDRSLRGDAEKTKKLCSG